MYKIYSVVYNQSTSAISALELKKKLRSVVKRTKYFYMMKKKQQTNEPFLNWPLRVGVLLQVVITRDLSDCERASESEIWIFFRI